MKAIQKFVGLCLVGLFLTFLLSSGLGASSQAQTTGEISFQQGQRYYNLGQYRQAIDALEEATVQFDSQNARLKQAITLNNLALAYQQVGQWAAAETAMQDCFQALGISIDPNNRDRVVLELDNIPTERLRILSPALNTYGQLWFRQAKSAEALASWQQAAQLYAALEDGEGQLQSQINQIQALHALGLYQQAAQLAEQLAERLEAVPNDHPLKSQGFRSLGDAERAIGNLGSNQTEEGEVNARTALHQALESATDDQGRSATRLSLGITYQALGNREKERKTSVNRQGVLPWQCLTVEIPDSAREYYEEAANHYSVASKAADLNTKIAAQLNHLDVLRELGYVESVRDLWSDLQQQLLNTEPQKGNRSHVYAQINLAKQGACLRQEIEGSAIAWHEIESLLKNAFAIAQDLGDPVAESYAIGNLGGLYEYYAMLATQLPNKDITKAQASDALTWRAAATKLTEQALLLGQPSELPDIAFQWQWQLGRLSAAAGSTFDAISHYEQAVETLKSVRGDLLTIDSEVQFSFRDNVEPVYRELVDLLLPANADQTSLKKAVDLIDTLQLAELENFLQCDLSGTVELSQTEVDKNSAVFYTVILKDRLEVITKLPGSDELKQQPSVRKPYQEIVKILDQLRQEQEKDYFTDEGDRLSLEVYTWLIKDNELALEQARIKTLIFVLDGSLRNVPIAALKYDESHYLVEKYAVALAPRLQLSKPLKLNRNNLKISFFGLSEMPDQFKTEFSDLPNVETEKMNLEQRFSGEFILNSDFTETTLEQSAVANPLSVVHFATHGVFSSDPENTFILAWDGKVKSNKIRDVLLQRSSNEKLELFVLSACQTADGDNRAALGLAGIALQAGAESTVASLWTVNDEATALMMDAFYTALTTDSSINVSRAEALRQAQLSLIKGKYPEPGFWAPYVLVGNWL